MKTRILMIAAALAGSVSLIAVSPSSAAAGKGQRQQAIADRLHQRLSSLNLTDDQESKVIDAFRTAREQMRPIRQQLKNNLTSVLTPEQRKALRQLHQKKN